MEGVDTGSQKKQFRDFKYGKPESKGNEVKDVKSNFSISKNNKSNERKGPPSGCFNCGGDHYANKCPVKTNINQLHQPLLPQQQHVYQQRIHATLDNRQVEQQIGLIKTSSKIYGNPVSILIDTRASECFISLKLFSRFPKRSSFMANHGQSSMQTNQGLRQSSVCLRPKLIF